MTAAAIETPAPVMGRRVTPTARLLLPADAPRDQWLAARRGDHRDGTTRIGSSDVADILGVGYNAPLRVYHEKRGELLDTDAGEAALWGHLHEETVAREWARRNRSVVRRVGLVANVDRPWMTCTLDRRVVECPLARDRREACALEIKTRTAWKAGQWLRTTPDDVLAQVLWQMAVTGYDHEHVAVLIDNSDYRQYVIRRADHEQIIADMIEAADLMRRQIIAGTPPEPSGDPDRLAELYDELHPNRSGTVQLTPEQLQLIERYESNRLAAKRYEHAKKTAKAEMIAALGDKQTAELAGETAYTYTERRGRPNVNLALLAEKYPDAYAECVTETTVRSLHIGRAFRQTEEIA